MWEIVICTALVLLFLVWWIKQNHACDHRWETVDTLHKVEGSRKSKVFVLQCEECGQISSKEIM